jgi:TnpA family transposase
MPKQSKWLLSAEQIALLKHKKRSHRLFFSILMNHYELTACFPTSYKDVTWKVKSIIARQLNLNIKDSKKYFHSRTGERYRKEIRAYFASLGVTRANETLIKDWVYSEILPKEDPNNNQLIEKVTSFMQKGKIEPFSREYLKRIINTAKHQYEKNLFDQVNKYLSCETKAYLDGLLISYNNVSNINLIKRWPRGLSLKTILFEAEKLKFLNLLSFSDIFDKICNKRLQRYYRNICSKYPSAIKEMPESHRYALLAAFAFIRKQQINDNLIELLIRLVKKIVNRAENKLKNELSTAFEIKKGIKNKEVLFLLANTILRHPDDVIKEAIFPVVSQEKLETIIGKKDKKPTYTRLVHDRARSSYINHYRRMLAPVLELLDFHSNNVTHQPIIEALQIIKGHINTPCKYYPDEFFVPIDGAIKNSQANLVTEITSTGERINRIDYELCVLRNLQEKVKTKEVWIQNSYKYRNPEKDLPYDFNEKRSYYDNILNKPQKAKYFIHKIKKKLRRHLKQFNNDVLQSKKVCILKKPLGHIKVAKLKERKSLGRVELIKHEIFKRWHSTSLLDVLKETNRYVNFLAEFTPAGEKEALHQEVLQKRLLLSLLGYGTNTGLKSVSIGNEDANYNDLLYVKRRYFDPDNIRNAIRTTVNGLFKIRSSDLWKECTTAIASDSSHFQATDQNLISSYHARYHKKGVMIYWHVDTNSVCIYSQLKCCSSSEVASMIEGVLQHCTRMSVEKNYVDTHGASTVGFAFSYLLNFDLLPRFKNIHAQKLYCVSQPDVAHYKNISSIIKNSIKWEWIEQQYDQIIKYASALKMGTADAESILRIFTKNNSTHPTYKALTELGKAIKTIFLCRYLCSEELRYEIHEGLNVVERWNSVNDFIFYGKMGILRSNRPEEFELSMLCLHLLQVSMVYINTLMVQQVLAESKALNKLTIDEKRAITPLLHEHINPYGIFPLDLDIRLSINHPHYQKAA